MSDINKPSINRGLFNIQMKINTKITVTFLCISILSIITASLITSWLGAQFGGQALKTAIEDKLIAVREAKKSQIENYFHILEGQIKTFSNDRMIIDAAREFEKAFRQYPGSTVDHQRQYNRLRQYYIDEYLQQYKKIYQGENIDIEPLLEGLSNKTVRLQNLYIKENPYPLGRKDELIDTGGKSDYESVHKKYHPHIGDYLKKFDYYDIFLVEPDTGYIIYSVFKEIDFATSLITGPYANSGIAQVFNEARQSTERDAVALADFQPYLPSYEYPASFMASPIYDAGEKIGILIFQMPTYRINQIMTYEENWINSGLGKSGETYLIGPDRKLRSQSRPFIEDKTLYFTELAGLDYADTMLSMIKKQDTTIGLQQVKTESVDAVLNGETGFHTTKNYLGASVLSAYTPLNVNKLDWAIITELDQEEADTSIDDLFKKISIYSLRVMVSVLIITIIAGIFLSRSLSRPIISMIQAITRCVNDIIDGRGDLTCQLAHSKEDETGELAKAINQFIETVRNIVSEFGSAAIQVASATEKMSNFVAQTNQGISRQCAETEQVVSAMYEMTATTKEVARNANSAAVATNKARKKSNTGLEVVQDAIGKMDSLATAVKKTANVIDQLEKNSKSIGSVLEVIHNITDQTNLLALNATIEAARAGEQGRGFSVVADEVRTLANHTQNSTQEIQRMIDELQKNAREATLLMKKSCKHAKLGVSNTNEVGTVLGEIKQEITNIDQLNTQIATAAKEQANVAGEINKNIVSISEISRETSSEADQIASSGKNLARLATNLQKQIAQYKV